MVSDKGTFRPWPEEKTLIEQYRKKYQLKDSLGSQLVLLNQQTIGSIQTDSSRNICQIEINKIPSLPEATEQEMQQLTPYNPANMKETKE